MFSIDNILAARPRCKDSVLPVAPSAAAPVVFPALHGDSLYGAGGGASSDYGAFYPGPVAPGSAGLPAAVGGSRLGYNNYFYGQLHVQAAPVGPACCGAVPPLGAQQCSCVPTPSGRSRSRGPRPPLRSSAPGRGGGVGGASCFSLCTNFSSLANLAPPLAHRAQRFPPLLQTLSELAETVTQCLHGETRLLEFPQWLLGMCGWTLWHDSPTSLHLRFPRTPIRGTPLADDVKVWSRSQAGGRVRSGKGGG